ncbi:ATP-binding protein [Kitasatospora purpeofusca]|uniref:ATP-binding protein n=1 Tax=Kitasatospora purpeofusca TaxID=67352 RepID=UPI002252533F|nr:ATP-binding protein [Kitasatospora purpeofusca]MCX4684066.1 ATP-binding protein [Kitasatospora purpeofusca]
MPATTSPATQDPYGFRVLPSAEAVPDARRRVTAVVRRWQLPLSEDTLGDVELLSSELITNAVTHTDAVCAVCVRWNGARLRVEVIDTGDQLPALGKAGPEATDGRGLFLVEALSSDWGIERDPDGKRVWFEVVPTAGAGGERLAARVRAAAPRVRVGHLSADA